MEADKKILSSRVIVRDDRHRMGQNEMIMRRKRVKESLPKIRVEDVLLLTLVSRVANHNQEGERWSY